MESSEYDMVSSPMRKLLLALGLCLCVGGAQAQPTVIGPSNVILCNKIQTITGTAALAQAIAPQPGQSINVCGWQMTNTAASGTFNISYGTGAACATTNTTITGTLSVGSTAVNAQSTYSTFTVPAGQLLCINATATITGIIWYSQF